MDSSPRPTRVRYGVMAFLCSLSFLTYFDRFCIVRAQSEIQRDLHISDPQMGLVLGASSHMKSATTCSRPHPTRTKG